MSAIVVVAHGPTGRAVSRTARARGHHVRRLGIDPRGEPTAALTAADAVVLIPRRGTEHQAHLTVGWVLDEARRLTATPHLLLVSSFAVGYGPTHPLNRATGTLVSRLAAERALRCSGLPATVVRPTWLTDDPPGAHAIVLTQDRHADGMISRADLAATLVAAVEEASARNTTISVYNQPGQPPRDWARLFTVLRRHLGTACAGTA
jgi:uncharacterized protein YbjT (DUF2867 family)